MTSQKSKKLSENPKNLGSQAVLIFGNFLKNCPRTTLFLGFNLGPTYDAPTSKTITCFKLHVTRPGGKKFCSALMPCSRCKFELKIRWKFPKVWRSVMSLKNKLLSSFFYILSALLRFNVSENFMSSRKFGRDKKVTKNG